MHLALGVLGQARQHDLFLAPRKEFRLGRIVGQRPQREKAQRQGGNALQNIHPLPAVQAMAADAQQPARQRRADDIGQRNAGAE